MPRHHTASGTATGNCRLILTCLLCILFPCSFALSDNSRDVPQLVLDDPDGITAFELFNGGIYWWDGNGVCTGEFPNDATIRLRGQMSSTSRSVLFDCHAMPGDYGSNTVRDGSFFYFVYNNAIHRKSVNADESDDSYPLPNAPAIAGGAYLDLVDTTLYIAAFNSTTHRTSIWKMHADGSQSAQLLYMSDYSSANGVRKMKWVSHKNAAGTSVESILLLLANGKLIRKQIDPSAAEVLMRSDATDFTILFTRYFEASWTRAYVTTGTLTPDETSPPGQLLKIDLASGETQTLYTASGVNPGNQLLSVTTDASGYAVPPKKVYITEGIVSCDMFCNFIGWALYRGEAVTGNLEMIVPADGGSNLRVDDQNLFFTRDDGIYYINKGVDPPELDFTADGLEVTQAGQTLNNDIRLIADRRTYARGYAHVVTDTTGKSQWTTGAHLHGYRNNFELPDSPLTPDALFKISDNISLAEARMNLPYSALFRLPDEWTAAGDLDLRFIINEDQSPVETGAESNIYDLSSPVHFYSKIRPCQIFVPICTWQAPTYFPVNHVNEFARIQTRMKTLVAVPEFNVRFFEFALMDADSYLPGWDYYPFTDPGKALQRLSTLALSLGAYCGYGTTHWVGLLDAMHPWPAADGGEIGGAAYGWPYVQVTRMGPSCGTWHEWNCPWSGRAIAHETAHNLGRCHINCGGDVPGCRDANGNEYWDVPPHDPCTLGPTNDPTAYYGFDPVSRSPIGPSMAADLMASGDPMWISGFTWEAEFDVVPAGSATPPGKSRRIDSGSRMILVQGSIDESAGAAQFDSIYIFPDGIGNPPDVTLPGDRTANYLLVMRDGSGAELGSEPLAYSRSVDLGSEEVIFAHATQFPESCKVIEIADGESVLGFCFASEHVPNVSISDVTINESDRVLKASWSIEDGDEEDTFMSLALYSPDNGASWQPLSNETPLLNIESGTTCLPGSTNARIAILSSDGFNTGFDLSEPFSLIKHPPLVMIGGIRNGESVSYGADLELTGLATDAEDGGIPGAELEWRTYGPTAIESSGESLTLSSLSPGEYTVTLSAVDSDSDEGSESIDFTVDAIGIPDTLLPVFDGLPGDAVYEESAVVEIPLTSGQGPVFASLVHADGDLYIGFSGLRFRTGSNPFMSVGIRIDADAGGDTVAQIGDRGFFVDQEGVTFQLEGDGHSMPETSIPVIGFDAKISLGEESWSAEMRISDEIIGGWDHSARIMFNHSPVSSGGASYLWPESAHNASPATWATAWFGTPPAPTNRTPVAIAGADQRRMAGARQSRIFLDGRASYDPDGDDLIYYWVQTGGPSVILSDEMSPIPYFFSWRPDVEITVSFQLYVSDGSLISDPALTSVTFVPSEMQVRGFGVKLDLPLNAKPGEPFYTDAVFTNSDQAMQNVPFFCVLDVYGMYFFYPRWLQYPPDIDFEYVSVPYGITTREIIPRFTWPSDAIGPVSGLYFYGAFLTSDFTAIAGTMDAVEWSYGL